MSTRRTARWRATHRPAGLVATAQKQRSQHTNRKLSVLKLAIMLEDRRAGSRDNVRHEHWSAHQSLERGGPAIRQPGPHLYGPTL